MRQAWWLAFGFLALQGCDGCGGGTHGGGGDARVQGGGDGPGSDGTGGDGAVSDAPAIPGMTALRIEPSSQSITDDGVAPGETATLVAIGTFDDGERDVTSDVAWSITDPGTETLVDGLFTSAGVGGVFEAVAAAGALDASAMVTVVLEVSTEVHGVPPGGAALFPEGTAGDVVDADALRIVYPSHETMFPRNVERILHQWSPDANLDLFEVRFDSDVAHLRIYTTQENWLPDADSWRWLAGTHAGSSVEMTVRGLDTGAPSTIYSSQTITLLYSRTDVLGALYYWSTGSSGVMRAHISDALATKFYTDPTADDANTCVACHTVSRDGRRLAVGYGGERLRQVSIPERAVQIPASADEDGPEYGWGTYNPDATRLLYASKGVLRLLNAESGELITTLTLPEGYHANHPDWSPSGEYVAVAYLDPSDEGTKSKSVEGSSLARIPVLASDTFGTPEVLVESTADDDTIAFPVYSPDSSLIAFVRTTGRSKDSAAAVLYLVDADGSGDPVAVTRLNERVRDEDAITGIGNSMPTWAPAVESGVFFLAFSSLRDYGNVLVGDARDQLWAAAINPDLVGSSDPSYAAFWLPFQDTDEGNHRAFWAHDPEAVCPATVELCDSLDNDCDGEVDEGCCTPREEVCDEADNDCDGVVDEGCGCTPTEEICDDGLDNDCDGDTDDADSDCLIQ